MDEHDWQPVSFVLETQLLGPKGQVRARQPDVERGRAYDVCMKCLRHSYVETEFVGYYLNEEP